MVVPEKWHNFAEDKYNFFSSFDANGTYDAAFARANDAKHGYGFTGVNEDLIRKELDTLFRTLKGDYKYPEVYFMYCYYCALMLQNYHQAIGQTSKMEHYTKLSETIKNHAQQAVDEEKTAAFKIDLAEKLKKGILAIIRNPVSKIRGVVAFANIHRLYWIFCRSTMTKSFLVARDLKWIDKLSTALGKHIDVEAIIQSLEKPNQVLKVFSVALFATRFIINAGMMLKHTIAPSIQEKDGVYRHWDARLMREVYKRHAVMLNDGVWATVNLLTNFNHFFHIANPVASWVTAGFLFFDIGIFLWTRRLAEKEYQEKRNQFQADREKFKDDKERLLLLERQIKHLDIMWDATNATFWFNLTAASLLMVGFTASLMLATPVMALVCYALCTFAVAMYMSGDVYKKYEEQRLLLKDAQGAKGIQKLTHDYHVARNDFILTLAKNAIIPTLLISTFAVCWQAALILTAAYIAFEIARAVSKRLSNNKAEALEKLPREFINSEPLACY
ncbi:MAG: hypothetical protein WC785_03985 [Tatlockia sp.]